MTDIDQTGWAGSYSLSLKRFISSLASRLFNPPPFETLLWAAGRVESLEEWWIERAACK